MKIMLRCLMLLCLCQEVMASPADDLSQLLNKTRTMQALFQQTVYDNHGKAIQKAYGQMFLSRPGKFRWEAKKPIPQIIIANATKLWIYDPDLEQVTVRKLKQTTGEAPALLLSHVNAVFDKNFKVQLLPPNSATKGQWFILIPRNQDNVFASVKLGFEHEHIREMRLADHLGHETRIQFSHTKVNLPLANQLFIFKPIAHIDIIDETEKKS